MFKINQDGADFNHAETDQHLFTASTHVKDFDMKAATAARAEFLDWMRTTKGIPASDVEFVL